MYDIIIVGGGPAGLTAATYACRAGKTVLVIEKAAFGGQITWSPKVENFPDRRLHKRHRALATGCLSRPWSRARRSSWRRSYPSRIAAAASSCAASPARSLRRRLIIATGAKPRMLGLEHEEELVGNGVGFCAVCDGAFYKGRDVAVNGGGNSALQDAMLLSETCRKVYLIHRRGSFRGEEKLVKALEAKDNVEVHPRLHGRRAAWRYGAARHRRAPSRRAARDKPLTGCSSPSGMSRITPFSPTAWSLTPRATPPPARIAAPGRPACLSR